MTIKVIIKKKIIIAIMFLVLIIKANIKKSITYHSV